MSSEEPKKRQPPGDDALDGFTRGSAEPFPVGGSRRETFSPIPISEQIEKIPKGKEPRVGDLVWSWSIWQEEYRMYELLIEQELCGQSVWTGIDLQSGVRSRLKRIDMWYPKG